MRSLGWLLDKKERVEELIDFEKEHLDLIDERVKGLKKARSPAFMQRATRICSTVQLPAPSRRLIPAAESTSLRI